MNFSFKSSGVFFLARFFLTEKKRLLNSLLWVKWSKLLKSFFRNSLTLTKITWITSLGSSIRSWSTASSIKVRNKATLGYLDHFLLSVLMLAKGTSTLSSWNASICFATLSLLLSFQATLTTWKTLSFQLSSRKSQSTLTSILSSLKPSTIALIFQRLYQLQNHWVRQLKMICSSRIMLLSSRPRLSSLFIMSRVASTEL